MDNNRIKQRRNVTTQVHINPIKPLKEIKINKVSVYAPNADNDNDNINDYVNSQL